MVGYVGSLKKQVAVFENHFLKNGLSEWQVAAFIRFQLYLTYLLRAAFLFWSLPQLISFWTVLPLSGPLCKYCNFFSRSFFRKISHQSEVCCFVSNDSWFLGAKNCVWFSVLCNKFKTCQIVIWKFLIVSSFDLKFLSVFLEKTSSKNKLLKHFTPWKRIFLHLLLF